MEARSGPLNAAQRRLVEAFERNGYVRSPNLKRRERDRDTYKKGWELRLVVRSRRELSEVRRLLRQANLKGGAPFKKASRWVQPIYGKDQVALILGWTRDN